jgi:hypothetical protein
MKIYVASSWRNIIQPEIVYMLKLNGHEVYDFKNPRPGENGFSWQEIDKDWQIWKPKAYRMALAHPLAEKGYKSDFDAMKCADVFVGVMPFGRSASMEMGWAAGNGKHTILLLHDGEPELMVKMFDYICCEWLEVIQCLEKIEKTRVVR